jgi:hypothetical protein
VPPALLLPAWVGPPSLLSFYDTGSHYLLLTEKSIKFIGADKYTYSRAFLLKEGRAFKIERRKHEEKDRQRKS